MVKASRGSLSILITNGNKGNTRDFLLLFNQRLNNLITMDQRSLLVTLLVDSTTLQAKGTRNWVVLLLKQLSEYNK